MIFILFSHLLITCLAQNQSTDHWMTSGHDCMDSDSQLCGKRFKEDVNYLRSVSEEKLFCCAFHSLKTCLLERNRFKCLLNSTSCPPEPDNCPRSHSKLILFGVLIITSLILVSICLLVRKQRNKNLFILRGFQKGDQNGGKILRKSKSFFL